MVRKVELYGALNERNTHKRQLLLLIRRLFINERFMSQKPCGKRYNV